ncbi:MAG: LemA family protein [Candidatus Levybacteria bacterium]|nr:LemA family protein [Candidatus Levybacteria bacterium]
MPIQIIILIIGVIISFYIWSMYNSLVTGGVRIKEALSGIDVQLKRRVDLIPNLIETVKGYAKHEKELLENLTKARTSLMKADTVQEKAASNDTVSNALKTLFAVSENYPNLKANENFLHLQDELSDTENKIAYARQFCNSNVRDYNTALVSFPTNFLSQFFGFKEREFFATNETEREPIKIKF